MYNRDIEHYNGYTVNLTNKVTLPDVDYINTLAIDKGFALGNSFKNAPRVLSDLYFLFRKCGEDPEAFNVDNHIFSSEYIEKEVIFRPLSENEKAYYKYTLLFLKKIEYVNVLGVTPLDKALNVLMYLTRLSQTTNPDDQYTETNDAFSNKSINIKDEEQLAKAIQEMSAGVKKDPNLPESVENPGGLDTEEESEKGKKTELSVEMTRCVRDHLYDLSPSIANIYGQKKPSDVPISRRILGDIKVKSYLESTVGLATSLDTKKVRNNDSTEKEATQMEEYSQVTKTRKSSMMLENFDEKLAKKELVVKEKVKPETKKQIIYVLLDDSGSMGNVVKQTYVRAVLMSYLESVVDGKSEIIFSLYESQKYHHRKVTNLKEAQNLFKDISLRRPNGGGTHIERVLQETIDEICNLPDHHDPEIMIVCDGDDYVNPDKLDYKGVSINCILLGTDNKNLKKVSEDSGGFYTCERMYYRY